MADRLKSSWLSRSLFGLTLFTGLAALDSAAAASGTEFLGEPTWQPAEADAVFSQLEVYLRAASLSETQKTEVRELWWSMPSGDAAGLLDRLAGSLTPADSRVAELVAFCSQTERPTTLPDFSWLADSATPPLMRHNLRLYLARWLAQNGYDDESLSWTDGLTPADVVAPEALLFYRAIASHRLVQADRADATLAELLQRPDDLPTRYQKLAMLMQQDLTTLEDDSLDHISRRMSDVRRRLALGRAGETVQTVENGVIESLDKLIKKLEDQAQQQQAQAGASGGGSPSGTPMQDSQLAELKAPGKTDRRDIGHGADWGELPDKEREQALQDIGREFPSHYREVIEEYFRQLAAEPSDGER
jgi:predicted transcriptional regulator